MWEVVGMIVCVCIIAGAVAYFLLFGDLFGHYQPEPGPGSF